MCVCVTARSVQVCCARVGSDQGSLQVLVWWWLRPRGAGKADTCLCPLSHVAPWCNCLRSRLLSSCCPLVCHSTTDGPQRQPSARLGVSLVVVAACAVPHTSTHSCTCVHTCCPAGQDSAIPHPCLQVPDQAAQGPATAPAAAARGPVRPAAAADASQGKQPHPDPAPVCHAQEPA